MNTPTKNQHLLCVAALLLAVATSAPAQNIYKCTQGGQITYTDHPCPGNRGELLHQADDADIIDRYLRLGQDTQARQYAQAHHLEALYQQRQSAHQQALQEQVQRQADDAYAAQQRAEQARQQSFADAAANQSQLRAENDALRQQNDQYQNQLAQPAYNAPPAYWNAAPPYWSRPRHDHDHDGHDRPPSKEPIFHPCTQLAGGRVQC